jgi:hypothetical protein
MVPEHRRGYRREGIAFPGKESSICFVALWLVVVIVCQVTLEAWGSHIEWPRVSLI